jgi:hypothetical protein
VPNEASTVETLQAKISDLKAALKQDDYELLIKFNLTPALNNLLGLLMALDLVTPEMVEQRLEIATAAKVAIHRLRALLKPYGIKIESRRHLGYWLTPETKARIEAMRGRPVPVAQPGNHAAVAA